MSKIARFCLMGLMLLVLMGANTVTITVTPNPGGVAAKLDGSGTFTVDNGTRAARVVMTATNTVTKQFNGAMYNGQKSP